MSPTAAIGMVLFALVAGVLAGLVIACSWRSDERESVAQSKAELQEQWDALNQTQRLNAAFWDARTAMRDEAMRQSRRPPWSWSER